MKLSNICTGRTLAVAVIAAGIGLGTGLAIAAQPNMEAALHALQNAEGHLEHVTQNKGGHAATARRLIGQAITEVQAGIQVGEEHGE
jgi:hypothetical protein